MYQLIEKLLCRTGVKNSGIGKEGPKFAVQEMTEEKLVVING